MHKDRIVAIFLLMFLISRVVFAMDIQITNKAGYDFCEMYFAPMNSESWGEDVLHRNVILNNATATVRLSKNSNERYNVMVVDEMGHKFYWAKLSLNNVKQITLKPESHADIQ